MTKHEAFRWLEDDNPVSVIDNIYSQYVQSLNTLLSDIKYTQDKDLIVSKIKQLKDQYK